MDQRIVQRFSVVYISSGRHTRVFRSMEEVPDEIRQHIVRSARSTQVETMVIANENGRDLVESRLTAAKQAASSPSLRLKPPLRWALATLLACGVGLMLMLVWSLR